MECGWYGLSLESLQNVLIPVTEPSCSGTHSFPLTPGLMQTIYVVWQNHKQALFYYSAWHIPLVFRSCSIQLHFLPWSLSYSNAKRVWLRARGGRESKNHTFRLIWVFLWSSESTSKHLSFIIFQVWRSFHRLQTSLHKWLWNSQDSGVKEKIIFCNIYEYYNPKIQKHKVI